MTARPEDVGVVPWAGNFKTSWTQCAVVGSRTEVSVVFDQIAALGECTCAFASTGQSFTSTSDASSGVFRAHFAPTVSGTHTVTATMRLGKLGLERAVTCAVVASVAVPASMASATVQYTWDGTTLSGGEGVTTIASTGLQTGGTYARVRRSGQERPTSVATFFTLDLSEVSAGDEELLARGYCPDGAPSGRALQAAETALGMPLRFVYVKGLGTPMVGAKGDAEFVRTYSNGNVKEYRLEETYIERSCFVLVVDVDLAAVRALAANATVVGVYAGAGLSKTNWGDPELVYDHTSDGVWAYESGQKRSQTAVRGTRLVYKVKGDNSTDPGRTNRLYAIDATTGSRMESAAMQNWSGGTNSQGWLHVSVHNAVQRVAFVWAELSALPDIEALMYVPPPMSSQPGLRAYASIGGESGASSS